MKYLIVISLLFTLSFYQESKKTLPNINLINMNGETINSGEFDNDGSPFIIAFWGSYCPHCHEELENISEVYEDWQDELGIKLIAIAVDDARTSKKVKPYVNGAGWEYEVYLDENSDMMKALSVNALPYIAVVNANKEIVYERFQYHQGAEEELYQFLDELK
jgi:thiol-disulfide isomerase/thioredoxin